MTVPTAFGSTGPVPFASAPVGDKDFGPSIGTAKALEKYIGKTLVIDVIGPVEFDDKVNGGKANAIDAKSVRVVETNEEFENQRLFPKGIYNNLKGYAGQTVIAVVGTYSTERFPNRQFVELQAPTAEQVAAATNAPVSVPDTNSAPF